MKLELRGITKRFPGVLANDSVDLTVESGEILGLLGENGAGKTTLMNVLYGLYRADSGEVLIDEVPQHFRDPSDAIDAGIGMVHQHFMLVPVFTVLENVIIGVEPTRRGGVIDFRRAREEMREISARLGFEIDPDAEVEDLPVGVQQRVEIVKVLFREAEFLIFDEPTAVLTPQEVKEFFEILRSLRDQGKAIIFITHKLREVLEVADRIAVLRGGKHVGEVTPAEADERILAEMMVGRPVELVVARGEAAAEQPVLTVQDLVALNEQEHVAVNGVSFEVRRGEIVGIAGVQGNGQTELVEALTGLRSPISGSVQIGGRDVTGSTPRSIHDLKVAHIPEDRQRRGLVLQFSVTENIILDSYHRKPYSRGLVMDWRTARQAAGRLVEEYDVRTPGIDVPLSNLSGGNQQKVIVAREFGRQVDLVIASQPTRGLDVGSIEYIHERIVQQRDEGSAILIISTELDEILALSDRILVMYRGQIVAEVAGAEATASRLGLYMAGATPS